MCINLGFAQDERALQLSELHKAQLKRVLSFSFLCNTEELVTKNGGFKEFRKLSTHAHAHAHEYAMPPNTTSKFGSIEILPYASISHQGQELLSNSRILAASIGRPSSFLPIQPN
jgi:hypothetical protein